MTLKLNAFAEKFNAKFQTNFTADSLKQTLSKAKKDAKGVEMFKQVVVEFKDDEGNVLGQKYQDNDGAYNALKVYMDTRKDASEKRIALTKIIKVRQARIAKMEADIESLRAKLNLASEKLAKLGGPLSSDTPAPTPKTPASPAKDSKKAA